MSEIEPRHLTEYLPDPYCPEDQAVGCRGCCSEYEHWQEIHEAGLCWKLDEECIICGGENEAL